MAGADASDRKLAEFRYPLHQVSAYGIALGLAASSQHYGLHPEHGACPRLGRLRHQFIGEPLQL